MSVRYGAWAGGPDPLEPPYDIAAAVDRLGDAVLRGDSPREALREMLRRGLQGRRGLDDLLRKVRDRRRVVRDRGRLDGTLERVRELLDTAVEQERAALFPDPSDRARAAETELDALPGDTARAVRRLADYAWTSPDAAATYEQIRDLLRREVLDTQFRGMKDALAGADPAALQRVKDMLDDLNDLLDADARGEDVSDGFAEFMAAYGDFFPDGPQSLEELVDSLARRAAAAQRMLNSLSPDQRDELANLMRQAFGDLDMAYQMDRLQQALRSRRPDLDWQHGERMNGGAEPLGMGDATTALQELADLEDVESALHQDYAGASLDDVDEEALRRALGDGAVDDLRALQRLERELTEQGYLTRSGEELELSPKAVRRIGASALARVFKNLDTKGRGDHDVPDAGAAGELTGASRAWRFGDEQPIDVVRTVRNAVVRGDRTGTGVRLAVDDFEVLETERRTSAAVCLLVDLSYSMALRGTWGIAKSTALALHALVTTKFPQDAIHLVGFSDYARELRPTDLAGLSWDMVQGTNLQHALMIAGRRLAKYPDSEHVVLVITDGEPTAHLQRDGEPLFAWPPLPETLDLTMAEVVKLTRTGATINVFMLDDEPRLVAFVEQLARRNGGRVFAPNADRLGDYVVSDYLRARRGRR
ncbi:MAG TPA: hypothetical protein VNA20_18840 [Frankiaceae bacterium]|nr:hypothetical protein [Frankiaceae bacterium]